MLTKCRPFFNIFFYCGRKNLKAVPHFDKLVFTSLTRAGVELIFLSQTALIHIEKLFLLKLGIFFDTLLFYLYRLKLTYRLT